MKLPMNYGDLSQKSLLNTVSKADKTVIKAGQTKWDGIVKGLKCYIQVLKMSPEAMGCHLRIVLLLFLKWKRFITDISDCKCDACFLVKTQNNKNVNEN